MFYAVSDRAWRYERSPPDSFLPRFYGIAGATRCPGVIQPPFFQSQFSLSGGLFPLCLFASPIDIDRLEQTGKPESSAPPFYNLSRKSLELFNLPAFPADRVLN